jgi:hypothetical protein
MDGALCNKGRTLPVVNLLKSTAVAAVHILREKRYSSYSLLTSALDRDEWSVSRPGRALSPGNDPVPTG